MPKRKRVDTPEESDESYSQDYENDDQKNGRNKLKKQYERFFEKEAIEASESEEDFDGDDITDNRNVQKRKEDLKRMEEYMWRDNNQKQKPQFLPMENDEDLEEYFQNKYKQNNQQEYVLDLNEEQLVQDAGDLPTMQDPKVFAVRCKFGEEKETVIQIMNKFIMMQDLSIYSATFIEKFPGYIYIEADKELHVKQTIQDLDGCLIKNRQYIKIILIKEVPQIYVPDQERVKKYEKHQWLRLKKAPYQGDIAQIIKIDANHQKATVRVIPRFNQENQKNIRPIQKFFVPSDHNIQVQRDEFLQDTQKFNGKTYQNGFLIQTYNLKYLQTENVAPTYDEIQNFLGGEKHEEDKNLMLQQAIDIVEKNKINIKCFKKGDRVRVIEGDLKNLIGVVIDHTEKQVTIIPQQLEINDPVNFLPSMLIKDFKAGDHVTLTDGSSSGQSGTILQIDERIASILIDNINQEVKCLINTLNLCQENNRKIENQSFINFKKLDLVKLVGGQRAGVILSIEKNFLTILDDQGIEQTISYFKIENKIDDKHVQVQNQRHSKINIDTQVRIVDGVNKDKTGIVKHIFKNQLFLFNREFQYTAGVFVDSIQNCHVISNNFNTQKRDMVINKDQDLIGKVKVVQRGHFKGYQGRVKYTDEKCVHLELQSSKIIKVDKAFILGKSGESLDIDNQQGNKYLQASKTPLGGKSVWHGQTPQIGMQSPGYNASPQYNFQSPKQF